MNQIRFDFLVNANGGSVNGGNSRASNANSADTGDAFAQILDQQLTRRADPAPTRRSDARTSRSDATERSDGPRPQVLKRRETKAATTATSTKQDAKPAPKLKQAEKAETSSATCAKPAAKPQQNEADETAEATAASPTAPESNGCNGASETEAKPDTSDDTPQQQSDGSEQQAASDGQDPTEAAAAEADLSLLAALAVPLPLQTLTADAEPAVLAGGDSTAALQAGLAASLAGSLDLTTIADGKVQAQGQAQANAGLKFGAVLKDAAPQQNAADPLAALNDTSADAVPSADPLTQLIAEATAAKPRDAGAATKRDTTQTNTAATVTPDQAGKSPAAVVQPVNHGAGVTWSGTSMRNEIAESMAVSGETNFAAADDAELSNWSQFLGANANGLSSSQAARQSAFMAQLKQHLQILPPHEQIAVQIRDAMQNGNTRLTVALHPVELGRVEVKLDIDKDKNVTATVIVDRPATLDLLQRDAKALERALQDAGLQTGSGSLSFNLRDSSGQNGGAAQNGTGTGGSGGNGAGGSDTKAETARPDVVALADGYVDLET